MNRTPFFGISKLSSLVVHRTRSLFDIESLLRLRLETESRQARLRRIPVTRWNE